MKNNQKNYKCRVCGENTPYLFPKNGKPRFCNKNVAKYREINNVKYYLSCCESCFYKEFPDKLNYDRNFFLSFNRCIKFIYDIPDEIYNTESKRRNGRTLESYIKSFGEKEGKQKWESYCKKQSVTNTFEYKKEKYGWSEEDFSEFNKKRSVTLDLCIKRHGEERGKKIFEDYRKKQAYAGNKLEYFIEKYGEKQGKKKYKEICKKKGSGVRTSGQTSYSKSSQELFNILDLYLKEKWNIDETYYHTKNKEKILFLTGIKKYAYLDFYIPELNLNIEYYGQYWHANPNIYKKDDKIMEYFAETIWENDKRRIELIKEEYNIDTFIVWENINERSAELNNIVEFLESKYKCIKEKK